MMKKIEVCIGTDRQGGVRARLSLIILDDDGTQIAERYHSFVLLPGDEPAAAREEVERHLADPAGGIPNAPWPKIPDAEWAKVIAVLPAFHTSDKIKERRDRDAKRERLN